MSNQFGITLMTLEFDKDCNMQSEFFGGSGSKGGCGGSGGCGGGGGCNGGSGGHNNMDLDTTKQNDR